MTKASFLLVSTENKLPSVYNELKNKTKFRQNDAYFITSHSCRLFSPIQETRQHKRAINLVAYCVTEKYKSPRWMLRCACVSESNKSKHLSLLFAPPPGLEQEAFSRPACSDKSSAPSASAIALLTDRWVFGAASERGMWAAALDTITIR